MNILTKNRILQAGDEYKSGNEWKPILPKDIGMQILFTTYKEVRRPSEAPYTPPTPKPKPISPDSPDSAKAGGIAKAESDNITLVPSHSGTGVTPTIDKDIPATEIELPTVISAKAHKRLKPAMVIVSGSTPEEISIPYTDLSALPLWTGRNGTFHATAIRLRVMKNGLIQIRPEGKRGLAKNALIEIPVADLLPVIKWLEEIGFGGKSTL